MLGRIRRRRGPWDVLVIGGGATGLGAALDAATRGYDTVLLEAHDFAKGTSSRSTKLVHGGVRYLRQGGVSLVREALRERALMLRNAAGFVAPLRFVIPTRHPLETAWYAVGLRIYDHLARGRVIEPSERLTRADARARLPGVRPARVRGGVAYSDARFDDARLCLALASTTARHHGVVVNHCPVETLLKREDGAVAGVVARDAETGESLEIRARAVINATGPFADAVRRMDEPGAEPIIRPSRGSHVVFPREFFPSDDALIVPKTPDGRVLFAIPFQGVVIAGTTDEPTDAADLEPAPAPAEIDFILETLAGYLDPAPTRADLRSVFAGIRPLAVVGSSAPGGGTARISREHAILTSRSGLITIAGGKWTTYRRMAEDVVDAAAEHAGLDPSPCRTEDTTLGLDAAAVPAARPLHPAFDLTRMDVRLAAHSMMARTVDDVLARRTRALIIDARAAIELAPRVAEILAGELGRDEAWIRSQVESFGSLAARYVPPA
jgi:glycerol-3-phosphate dehydrogenase